MLLINMILFQEQQENQLRKALGIMKQLFISSLPIFPPQRAYLPTAREKELYCSIQVQILLHLTEIPNNVCGLNNMKVILLHTEKVQIGNACWNSGSIKSSRTQDPSALSFFHPYFSLWPGWQQKKWMKEASQPFFFPLKNAA